MTSPTTAGLSPVEALQRIDAILRDPRMTLAERVATVGVVLRAGRRNATAFPGFRFLRQQYRLGGTAIGKALAVPGGLALGVHLEPDGHGPRGVQRFRVLPVPDDDPPDGSAPMAGALDNTASAPTAGALQDGQCAQSEPPARPNQDASAPGSGVQCAHSGRETNVVTSAELARERTGAADAATDSLSLAAARRGENNSDKKGNGAPGEKQRNDGDEVGRVIAFAFPGGASEKQQAAVVNAIGNAVRQGASYPLLAHAVRSPRAEGKTPWDRIEGAGERTAGLLSEARRAWRDFKGTNLLDLFNHVPPGFKPEPVAAREGESENTLFERQQRAEEQRNLAWEIDGWRMQGTTWPGGRSAASAGVKPPETVTRGTET